MEDIKSKNSLIEDKMIECLERMDETENILAKKRDEFLQLSDHIIENKRHAKDEEGKPPIPQVERELLIRVDKVLAFSHAPHSDAEE